MIAIHEHTNKSKIESNSERRNSSSYLIPMLQNGQCNCDYGNLGSRFVCRFCVAFKLRNYSMTFVFAMWMLFLLSGKWMGEKCKRLRGMAHKSRIKAADKPSKQDINERLLNIAKHFQRRRRWWWWCTMINHFTNKISA